MEIEISKLCQECIKFGGQAGGCIGKDKRYVAQGKLPCKKYELDPQLISNETIEPGDAPPSLKDRPEPVRHGCHPLIPKNILPTNKIKVDNFERLAIQRLTTTLDGMRKLGNLSNKANYEWIQEQTDIMLSRIRSAADVLEKKFQKK